MPVPNANTRVEGSLAGQYHYADLLPVEALSRLEKSGGKTVPILTPSFGFPYLVLNTKEGVAGEPGDPPGDPDRHRPRRDACGRLRRHALLHRRGQPLPEGHAVLLDRRRRQATTSAMPPRPRPLAEKAGYKGEPIRILTSRQYDFHYNMALVMAEQLKRAGFKAELNVVDWATLVQRRNDPKLWDIYITHSGLFPEPMLSPPQLGDGAPGLVGHARPSRRRWPRSTSEADPAKRGALWGKVQQVVYDEVPYIHVGKFNGLSARARRWRATCRRPGRSSGTHAQVAWTCS